MARKIAVEIVGDSRQLERAFQRSGKSAKQFNQQIGRLSRGGIAASGLFRGMGQSIAFASGTFLGGAGLVAGMKSAVEAASDLNEQVSKTNVVFGESAGQIEAWSKTTAQAMGLSQRQALATASSFGALFKPIGLVGPKAAEQAKALTQLGGDLASFYNTSVQDALDAVRSGIVGESEPLRRYGVLLSETRVRQEAMAETGRTNAKALTNQEKAAARVALIFKDTALAQGDFARTSGGLANQLRQAQANIEDLRVAIGRVLVPEVTKAVNVFNEWISQSQNQAQVIDTVKQAASAFKGIVGGLRTALEGLNTITGSTKDTVRLLFTSLVAFKTAKLASTLASIATNVGLIGTNAEKSTGKLGVLRRTLGTLALVEVIAHKDEIERFFDKQLHYHVKPLGSYVKEAAQWMGIFADNSQRAAAATLSIKETIGKVSEGALRTGELGGGARAGAEGFPAGPAPRRGPTGAQRYQWWTARIQRMITRAQYKGLQDQLAMWKRVADLIRKRIAVTKDITRKLNLEDQLLEAVFQQKQIRADIAAKAVDAARERAEKRREALEKAARRREARLFGILGFGPAGEELVPSAAALRRRLAGMQQLLQGAPASIQRQVAKIRRVLAEQLIPTDVRAKIKEMLDGIRDEIKGFASDIADPTKFTHVDPGKFLAGLGLSPQQIQRLRLRLATIGAGGKVPRGGTIAFAGATGGVNFYGATTLNVNGVQNVGELEQQLTKRQASRAHNRRGAR
jgi:hypothetical protein